MSQDLEFWKQGWQENSIRFHQKDHSRHLEVFSEKLPKGRIFVPLCGKSKDMLWLLKSGYSVVGVEISPIACRDFFEENGLSFRLESESGFEKYIGDGIVLWCGNFYDLPLCAVSNITGVFDRASLVAIAPKDRQKYAQTIAQIADHIPVLTLSLDYPQERVQGPPFSVPENEVRELFENAKSVELLLKVEDRNLKTGHPKFRNIEYVDECVFLITP